MVNSNLFKILLFFFLIFSIPIGTFAQDYESEDKALKKLYSDMGDALMKKDWERFQSYFIQDSTLNVVHPGNRDWARGWQEVEMRYKPLFRPEVNMNAEVRLETWKVYMAPGSEFAWVLFDQKVEKEEGPKWQSWGMMVFKKKDGKWRVNAIYDVVLPPPKESFETDY